MSFARLTAVIFATLTIGGTAIAQTGATYHAEGQCPGQPKPYIGEVTLSGSGPVLRWRERIGSGQIFEGVAIQRGDSLSVGFIGDFRGVLQATRTADGWDGVWAGADPNAALCREHWTRQ